MYLLRPSRIARLGGRPVSAAEDVARRRRDWARRMRTLAAGPIPSYGSETWLALPEGDGRKVAAVVIAAECWAYGGDELEQRLRAEVAAASVAHKRAEDADYRARRDAHRAEWEPVTRRLAETPIRSTLPARDLYDIGAAHARSDRDGGGAA